MGCVDTFNRNRSLYDTKKTSKRWWMPIFHFCHDSATVNSWKLYQQINNCKIPKFKFLCLLASQLIGDYSVSRKKSKNRKKEQTEDPYELIEKIPSDKRRVRRRCFCGCGKVEFRCKICKEPIKNDANHGAQHLRYHLIKDGVESLLGDEQIQQLGRNQTGNMDVSEQSNIGIEEFAGGVEDNSQIGDIQDGIDTDTHTEEEMSID